MEKFVAKVKSETDLSATQMDNELVSSVDKAGLEATLKNSHGFNYTDVKEGLSVNPATFHWHATYGVQE